jgi:hypothetical protein
MQKNLREVIQMSPMIRCNGMSYNLPPMSRNGECD